MESQIEKIWLMNATCSDGGQMCPNHSLIDLDRLLNPVDEDNARPFQLALYIKILWSSLFGLMVFVAVVGNLSVLWIIIRYKNMRTTTNAFLFNLSLADLMMATFNAMFNFAFMLNGDWPFGQIYCTVNNVVATLTVASSVFTIMATSIERYIAVMYPLRPRMPHKKSMICLIIIWVSSSILAFPSLLYSTIFTFDYEEGQTRTICAHLWPDGVPGVSLFDYIYSIIFFCVAYALPMISMGITYTRMGRVLWGSRSIGEMNAGQREAVRAKQRVVPMLITVTVVFCICWLPYHVYFMVTYHFPEITQLKHIQHVFLAFYWLAMSNSAFNPIIYALLNQRFRRCFKAMFCCWTQNEPNETVVSINMKPLPSSSHSNVDSL